jgi:HK97 family phage prohead protease
MGQLIEKTFDAIIKDVDVKKGIIEGYFNTWDIVDSDGDELMRGAFKKSIQERGPESSNPRIFHLWQHSSRNPLYRFVEDGSLVEDNKGLFFKSKISKTTYGRDVLQLYDDGVVNEHSVGFITIKNGSAPEGHNRIFEGALWEGSTVTWGANMETPVTDIKSVEETQAVAEKFNERIELLTKSLKDGSYTDDTFVLLELQLKQIQAHYDALVKQIPAGPPTGNNGKPGKKVEVSLNLFDN